MRLSVLHSAEQWYLELDLWMAYQADLVSVLLLLDYHSAEQWYLELDRRSGFQ